MLTLANVATPANVSAFGTGLQLIGTIYSAVQAQQMGRYNAQVAQANAQQEAFSLLNEAQQRERLAGMLDEEAAFIASMQAFQQAQLNDALMRQEGETVAQIGASGVGFRGSPIAVLEENARQGQIQALLLKQQAALQTRAVREEQTQQRYAAALARFGATERLRLGTQQAGMARYEGQQQMASSILQGAGALATGVGRYQHLQARQEILME